MGYFLGSLKINIKLLYMLVSWFQSFSIKHTSWYNLMEETCFEHSIVCISLAMTYFAMPLELGFLTNVVG